MISPDELKSTMRAALDDERNGIRTLDVALVDRATRTKEAIIAGLLAVPSEERAPLIEVLDGFKDDLRENLILLTHARAHLREAAELSRVPGGRQLLEVRHGVKRINESVMRMKDRLEEHAERCDAIDGTG